MGFVYLTDKKEECVYGAYCFMVYAKTNEYEWTINDNPNETVYTSLRIERNGTEIYNREFGNRCIFQDNFDRTIDNFLWWLDKDMPDEYEIERTVENSLCSTNSLFNHRINNRKQKEREKAAERERYEKAEAERERKLMTIKMYCEKKKLLYKQYYDEVYLIKLHNEKARQLIEDADNKHFEMLKDFMTQHPNNKDAVIAMNGKLEDIIKKIS